MKTTFPITLHNHTFESADAHHAGQLWSSINVGQLVRVRCIALREENCWPGVWFWGMNRTVGRCYDVVSIADRMGILLSNGYYYPFFVLEVVNNNAAYIANRIRQWEVLRPSPNLIYETLYNITDDE